MAARFATVTEVTDLAPALLPLAGAVLTLIVDTITHGMLREDVWGTALSDGHRCLAAHIATITLNPSAAGGPVTARAIDKISESYASGAMTDAELSTTVYGRMFLLLRANLPSAAPTSVGVEVPPWTLDDERIM